MLTNITFLKGLVVQATDGELGTVDQFYFDDETWAIRYLTVETGGWLGGRQVLISPFSILHTDWPAKRLNVALTKKQVENSPEIHKAQKEQALFYESGVLSLGEIMQLKQPSIKAVRRATYLS